MKTQDNIGSKIYIVLDNAAILKVFNTWQKAESYIESYCDYGTWFDHHHWEWHDGDSIYRIEEREVE